MKVEELRNLSNDELDKRKSEIKKELFKQRGQVEFSPVTVKMGVVEQPKIMIREMKREIARIETILNERKSI